LTLSSTVRYRCDVSSHNPHKEDVVHIVSLTQAEAADPAILRNLMASLLGQSVPGVLLEARIAHEDRPDVGAPLPPVVQPAAPVIPTPPAAVLDTAKIFGGAAAPANPPVPAPSTAAAVAPPTAPAVATSTIPQPPSAPSPSAAPTAPVAAAPAAPAAPSTPAPAVDSAGLPWDARIHSRTKTTTQDGRWRQKRDTPPALVAQVEAELKQLMAIPSGGGAPAPAAMVAALAAQPVLVPQPPAAAPAAAIPAPPAAAPATAPTPTAAEFMQWVTPFMTTGVVTQAQLIEACKAEGLMAGLPSLIQRPDLAPAVKARLVAMNPTVLGAPQQ
jgi:hypothetical protein